MMILNTIYVKIEFRQKEKTMETNEHILNRADMINMIAKKINAKSYLEIGEDLQSCRGQG